MSQIYSHCNIPQVKEAAWCLFVSALSPHCAFFSSFAAKSLVSIKMSAINLVKSVPEAEQEKLRNMHVVRVATSV